MKATDYQSALPIKTNPPDSIKNGTVPFGGIFVLAVTGIQRILNESPDMPTQTCHLLK